MNTREKEIRFKLKTDFIHYAEKCLKIRTKKGRIEPLRLNTAQEYIHHQLEQQLKTTGKVRALILKGRQQGCSTYVEARFYWKVTHGQGLRAFILTHLEEASRNVHQMAKRFHENCPALVKPHTGFSNSRELIFDVLDSGYQIGTAKSKTVGRSNTLQYFHGSEVAYWSHAHEHMSGVLQAVPDTDGTEVILESTSAGADGLFYQLCQDAIKGRSDFIFIFVPWFWQKEYTKKIPDDFILTDEEQKYKQEYHLTDGQMSWRRQKIYELGSIWTFRREYPSTPDEAFLADKPDALWTRHMIQKNRIHPDDVPDMKRIVVAIDPATTSKKSSDETGIIVAGLGTDDHGYVLADLSGKYTPAEWASIAVHAYYKYQADRVIAEVNQGGDMVEHTLRSFDETIAYMGVHASRGKIARAEPIAALDARGLIHHTDTFSALENQMCRFDPTTDTKSPDRVDARTWALTALMISKPKPASPRIWGGRFI